MHHSWVESVDRFYPQQCEEKFLVLRRADEPTNRLTTSKTPLANVTRADINVVFAGEIRILGAAQEAESLGHDVERSFRHHQSIRERTGLENLKDQPMIRETSLVLEPQFARFLQ